MMNSERVHGISVWAILVGAMCGATLEGQAYAQCGFDWAPGFQAQGLNAFVTDLAVFDDGTGNGAQIYAVGPFTTAGGSSAGGVAKWDGKQWLPVGDDLVHAHCIEVLPEPSGDGVALYVGGSMVVDGVQSYHVAKWSGSEWMPIGGAMNSKIRALEVFDDGSGASPQLYAAGEFTTAGGVNAMAVAKWDGAAWAAVQGPTTFTGFLRALEVFDDDGDGPNAPHLYAGGNFTSPGGQIIKNIAKWNGQDWSSVGGGVSSWSAPAAQGGIYSIAVHDEDGSEPLPPALFACGKFGYAGGIEVNNIASWNGASWSSLDGIFFHPVYTLISDAKGLIDGRPALYVGGEMTAAAGPGGTIFNKVARWDGETWAPLSSGVLGSNVSALAIVDSGSGEGSNLLVAGAFLSASGVDAEGIATWDGENWSALNDSLYPPAFYKVTSLLSFDDGSAERLFVGLESQLPYGPAVASYDGSDWYIPGSLTGRASALAVFDDGSGDGPALFAGGLFPGLGLHLRRWTGREWVQIVGDGGYPTGLCANMCVHQEKGKAPVLFVAGKIGFAPPVSPPIRYLMKYDGETFTPISGVVAPGNNLALASFDDGSGQGHSLYAAGYGASFDGMDENIARWTGSEWVSVGGGLELGECQFLTAGASDLEVFDDGSGPALYAAGRFGAAGGVLVCNIAKWDGTTWSEVGGGITTPAEPWGAFVAELTVFDGALYASGRFTQAGSTPVNNIAKWDGKQWTALGHGIEVRPGAFFTYAAHGWQDSLFVGGDFTHAGGLPSHNFAKWTAIDDEPVIVDQPVDADSNLGQPVAFTVAAWGGELSYQWRKDGIELVDGEHISGATTPTLHIENVTGDDAGSFDVLVSSNCGEVISEAAILDVHCQYDIAPSGFTNGIVDVDDLLMVINAWGQTGSAPADVNDDGIVDQGDLTALIAAWGECP